MNLNFFIKNKNFLLVILIFNLLGIIFSFYTYTYEIIKYINNGQFYLIPFFMVSFWLFLLAFYFVLYIYLDKRVPNFLACFAFVYCFVYGFGSFLFYPLFMIFVRGLTLYHAWNIVAHVFVGLQSLLFFRLLSKPKIIHLVFIMGIFFIKDFLDWFSGGFLYFVKFGFPDWLRIVLALVILGLQVAAFYLLVRKTKRLK